MYVNSSFKQFCDDFVSPSISTVDIDYCFSKFGFNKGLICLMSYCFSKFFLPDLNAERFKFFNKLTYLNRSEARVDHIMHKKELKKKNLPKRLTIAENLLTVATNINVDKKVNRALKKKMQRFEKNQRVKLEKKFLSVKKIEVEKKKRTVSQLKALTLKNESKSYHKKMGFFDFLKPHDLSFYNPNSDEFKKLKISNQELSNTRFGKRNLKRFFCQFLYLKGHFNVHLGCILLFSSPADVKKAHLWWNPEDIKKFFSLYPNLLPMFLAKCDGGAQVFLKNLLGFSYSDLCVYLANPICKNVNPVLEGLFGKPKM